MGTAIRWSIGLVALASAVFWSADANAVPTGYLYWASRPSGTQSGIIYRSNLDGSGRTAILTGLLNPGDVTVHGNRIYWSEQVNMSIRTANLDGSDVRTLFNTGHNTYDLEIDPYTGEFYRLKYLNQIMRTNPVTFQDNLIRYVDYNEAWVGGIALNPTTKQVFWAQGGNTPALRRCERNGTGATTLLSSGLVSPEDVEYDAAGGNLYWVDSGVGSAGALFRARADGTQATQLADVPFLPRNLVIDEVNDHIYVVGGGGVIRYGLDGSNPTMIQSGAGFGVAIYIPEPGTILLLTGALLLGLRRDRSRR